MFLGTHKPRLDDKHRVILPAKFRDALADGLVMTKGQDRCVVIYTSAGFAEYAAQLRVGSQTSEKVRAYTRVLFASAYDDVPDRQGRVTIPSHLREYALAKIPDIWMPNRSDLCFATTNRQGALRAIASSADAVVVIGSANSSNTVALTDVARSVGSPRVLRVNGADELPDDLSGVVAVTAGASAPESLVSDVVAHLGATSGVDSFEFTLEDEYVPPPPELREILRALCAVLDVALGAPRPSSFDGQADRDFTAAQVLAPSR